MNNENISILKKSHRHTIKVITIILSINILAIVILHKSVITLLPNTYYQTITKLEERLYKNKGLRLDINRDGHIGYYYSNEIV